MSESIKTTELTEVTSVANTDTIVVDVSAGTRKVTKENLLKEINTEINNLKNSVND